MSLQTIINAYNQAAKLAARDPAEYSFTVRPGIEIAVRTAQEQMKTLAAQYATQFNESTVGIFLDGETDKVNEVVALFKQNAVVADAQGLYSRIAAEVEPGMGASRMFTHNQASRALSTIREIGMELDIMSLKLIDFGPAQALPTTADVVAHIRAGIRNAVGDDLNRVYLAAAIARDALKLQYVGVTPVVLVINAQPYELAGLEALFGKGAAPYVVAGSKIDEEYVSKMLKEVNKKLKRK